MIDHDNQDEAHAAQILPFGGWLVQQKDRGGFIGGLAEAAAKDRKFPRTGGVKEVKDWLQNSRASGDDWEALEDAELDYHAL